MKQEVYQVATNDIAYSADMQVRSEVDGDRVTRYAEDIQAKLLNGEELGYPPIELWKVEDPVLGEELWLVDGFHRFYAYQEAGLKEHDAIIKVGTKKEARLRAMTANYEHENSGVGLKGKDRQHAVEVILEECADEINLSPDLLTKKMIELGVPERSAQRDTQKTRGRLKEQRRQKAIKMLEEGITQREIAKATGINFKTLSELNKARKAENEACSKTASGENRATEADDDEISAVFGDETADESVPTVNPMDDLNKTLAKRDAARAARELDNEVASNDYESVANTDAVGELGTEHLMDELLRRLESAAPEDIVIAMQQDADLSDTFSALVTVITPISRALNG